MTIDESEVGYAKKLYKDGSYGKREIVNKNALNSTVKNAYTKKQLMNMVVKDMENI